MCAYAGVCQKGAWGQCSVGRGAVQESTVWEPVPHPAMSPAERAPKAVQWVALVSQWQMDPWTHQHHRVSAACGLPPAGSLCAARGITGLPFSASSRGGCSWGREETDLWMFSFGFQTWAGYQAPPLCTNADDFKPSEHLKQLDLVIFPLRCDIIAVRVFTCDYFVNVPILNISFCPR